MLGIPTVLAGSLVLFLIDQDEGRHKFGDAGGTITRTVKLESFDGDIKMQASGFAFGLGILSFDSCIERRQLLHLGRQGLV